MTQARSKAARQQARKRTHAPARPQPRASAGSAGAAALRKRLIELLRGGGAHVTFRQAIADFPARLRGTRPGGAKHSAWQVLEHMRICQWDIVEFSRDPRHVPPEFPAGLWPPAAAPPDAATWERSVAAFESDLRAMERLVARPTRDLHARVDHPEAKAHHTLAREAIVLADHNAYHLGELVLLRRLLGAWHD